MKLVHFKANDCIRLGIMTEQGVVDIKRAAMAGGLKLPTTLEEVMAGGQRALSQLEELVGRDLPVMPEEEVDYAPCVLHPEKILCIGINYRSHAEETGARIPEQPVVFSKFGNALAAHRQVIPLPRSAMQYDYEAELVIVIGRAAANVSEEDALSCIFGYTAGNDLSARDLQFRTTQWLLGKTCDSFAPIGPCLVTADEVNPANLRIEARVNGQVRQSSNTSDMIFGPAALVSYISRYMTLKPGDIIFTGTPSGVILGYPEEQRQWLKPGDEVSISIENIGTLVNVMG